MKNSVIQSFLSALSLCLFLGYPLNISWAVITPTAEESHDFHVSGVVTYRCHAGYDGKKMVDERTKQPCNNETYTSRVIDKTVSIIITDEPDPENSNDLEGSWSETFEFKGRKFVVAISLFKNSSNKPYRIRIVANDDQPSPRNTAMFAEMKTIGDMNSIFVDYFSVGKNEEIRFWVSVHPAPKN
jgi:hypothetical protein